MTILLIVTPIVGFSYFTYNLSKVKDVVIRLDHKNNRSICFRGIQKYIAAPLKYGSPEFKTMWGLHQDLTLVQRAKCLEINWVACTVIPIILIYGISKIFPLPM